MKSVQRFDTIILSQRSRQRAALHAELSAVGLAVVELPLIAVMPAKIDAAALPAVVDLLIFVSPAAAEHGVAQLPSHWRQLPRFAVGVATAETLAEHGWPDTPSPLPENSEGLLALPALAQVAGRQIVIVRGDGGRELLAETLRARGADVHYLEVYRKTPLDEATQQAWRGQLVRPHIVLLSSVEAATRLCAIIPATSLREQALVVSSQRIADPLVGRAACVIVAASSRPADLLAAILAARTDCQGNF